MPPKLLTIIVPTYNRAQCLALLLRTLLLELAGLQDRVDVIVGDNASTDETPALAAWFASQFGTTRILRHARNVGPDENFCRCLAAATSRFVWLIGDDDLPKTGVIARVVDLLESRDPDLLYLGSEWLPGLSGPAAGRALRDRPPLEVSSADFAGYVNVWVTFISGMVVNWSRLIESQPGLDVRRFSGTSLVQLGWVLPLLMSGRRFLVVTDRWMLATSGNTGGYKLLTVFATNFPAILDTVCGPSSPQRRKIVCALAWNYVPGLLWLTRFGDAGRFSDEDVLDSLTPLRTTAAYRLVIMPIMHLPRPLALPFWTLSRVAGRVIRFFFSCKLAVRPGREQSGYAAGAR